MTAREEAASANVLEATRAVQEALGAMDMAAFESALASRERALQELETLLASEGRPCLTPEAAGAILRADAHLRTCAVRRWEELRSHIVELDAGRRSLAVYSARGRPEPRFADHRG